MTPNDNAILKDTQRGATVEADGNAPTESVQLGGGVSLALDSQNDPQAALGPNNELLEQAAPRLVNALRELVVKFREEGIVARRHEIRRIRQARLFWQGLQYAFWNPQDMNWHLPWEAKIYDDSSLAEMPRYQFVTNLYQAFGLSFVSVISQDVPATRFYPQSTLSEADIETAKAASQVADLIEQNNRVQQLLTSLGFFLWTDGKIGGYVRYVADGQRFGWRDELMLEERWVRMGRDTYVCPSCGAETEVGDDEVTPEQQRDSSGLESGPQNDTLQPTRTSSTAATFLAGTICAQCGAALGPKDFRPAPLAPVPQSVGTRRVANGQEVISIIGGLELNTPVWANEQYEFPYLQWQMEVHRAKLKAAFPQAADKIQTGGPQAADDIYARATRVAVAQGMPTTHPGDALFNLITFSRTWIRPWAFYSIEDIGVRDQLLRMFPEGCYVAFAGETYCESRNETMDDCWRVMHALPGDGQNRPSVGDSLIEVQERYNTLSNIQAETYEYGIPPIYADPQVLDFDALSNQTAEPAAHYPARARPGMSLADGFFQPAPAQVPPDMLRHQQDLMGPIAQFLTGLFPAVFGGEMENVKTASGYAMARDQALGRLGLVWRRLKSFYSDLMLLSVDCFRKNRPGDVEIPFLGAGGEFEARFIRLANLKGNIQAHPESDETFPRLKSQQRAVLQQLMSNPDPTIQAALREPANLGFVKSLVGLSELVVPGDDARNKQLREIQLLLTAGPVIMAENERVSDRSEASLSPAASEGETLRERARSAETALRAKKNGSQNDTASEPGLRIVSTVPVDELLDDHATEFEECRRWASSDAGQIARAQNPAGFANVHAHAAEHAAALARQQAQAQVQAGMPAPLTTATSRSRPHPSSPSSELHTSSELRDQDGPDEHWVTINGNHVLIHEPDGRQDQETPQSLAAQIPCDVKDAIARALNDSNAPTADDKKGGFHEEYGVAGLDASGKWVISRDKPGPYGNPDVTDHVSPSGEAVDPNIAYSIREPRVAFHVHPAGITAKGKVWRQPPSDEDKEATIPGQINIVLAAREKRVYFYDRSGIVGKPMKVKDFLCR